MGKRDKIFSLALEKGKKEKKAGKKHVGTSLF